MSEEQSNEAPERNSANETSGAEQKKQAQSGPAFTESPDPLSGIRKATDEAWKKTEGKTVSLRVYIGSIIGVIILMVLARCGG